MKIIACNSNKILAESICSYIGVKLANTSLRKFADKEIYHCKGCGRCWQTQYVTSANGINYYDDFPKYKRKHKTCKRCK